MRPFLLSGLFALATGCSDAASPPSPPSEAGSATTPGSHGSGDVTCFVDYPCEPHEKWRCKNEREYEVRRTFWCNEVCGGEPCSGGTCRATGDVVACPSGTQCIDGRPGRTQPCGVPGEGDAGADADAAPSDAAPVSDAAPED